MKFGVITINNKRPKVLHLWCASIKRLRAEVGYFPAICVSGADDIDTCMKYTISHIEQVNDPANEKWMTALSYLKIMGVDYAIISGSDDIFSNLAFRNLITAMEGSPDVIGFNELYIYSASGNTKGKMKHITTKGIFGVGKTLSKRVLDATNWRPWEYGTGRNWGMDAILARNTAQHIKSRVMVKGTIVDVKTTDSLNKFTMFERNRHGHDVSNALFYEIMGEEERRILAEIEGRVPSLDMWFSSNTRNNLL